MVRKTLTNNLTEMFKTLKRLASFRRRKKKGFVDPSMDERETSLGRTSYLDSRGNDHFREEKADFDSDDELAANIFSSNEREHSPIPQIEREIGVRRTLHSPSRSNVTVKGSSDNIENHVPDANGLHDRGNSDSLSTGFLDSWKTVFDSINPTTSRVQTSTSECTLTPNKGPIPSAPPLELMEMNSPEGKDTGLRLSKNKVGKDKIIDTAPNEGIPKEVSGPSQFKDGDRVPVNSDTYDPKLDETLTPTCNLERSSFNNVSSTAPAGGSFFRMIGGAAIAYVGFTILKWTWKKVFPPGEIIFQPSSEVKEMLYKLGSKCNMEKADVEAHLSMITSSDQLYSLIDSYHDKVRDITIRGLSFKALYEIFVRKLIYVFGWELLLFGIVTFACGSLLSIAVLSFFFLRGKGKDQPLVLKSKQENSDDNSNIPGSVWRGLDK